AGVRGSRLFGATCWQHCHPRNAGPGRVEGAGSCSHERDRGVHQPFAAQTGSPRVAAASAYDSRRRLSAGGRAMRLSIRWRLTFWNTLALAFVLMGFAALVYGLSARALYQQTDQRLASAWGR